MQINGLREFAAKFMPSFQKAEQNQTPAANYLSGTDEVDVSWIGKSTRPEDVNRTRLESNVQAGKSDAITNLMDSSFTRMQEILEEMNTLTVTAAEDESLNELDRMLMQVRMEDLRMELYNVSRSLNEKLAVMANYDGERDQVALEPPTNDRGVLDRALKRLDKGEAWDVAEAGRQYRKYTKVAILDVEKTRETGTEVIRTIWPEDDEVITLTPGKDQIVDRESHYVERVEAYVMKDADRYIYTKNLSAEEIRVNARYVDQYSITDGVYGPGSDGVPDMEVFVVPTVRDKMEAAGTIILMDAESAKKGTQLLKYEVEKYRAMKDEFEEFKKDPQRNRALTPAELSALNAEYESMLAELLAAQESGEESMATKLFLTEIGIMKTDGEGNNPTLVYAAGPKGAMFSKLDRFFRSTTRDFADNFIDENLFITDIINVNLAWKDIEDIEEE